ncbi:unnamed protein product [Rotaria sp. Silwood1]|nr:unnamed protein product [Rotaria sp. Silwood1]CAF1326457.1 unnamed protein product [Rotaria sp. Silwood1]CAF3515437.1 unnamed protein product [Rotaria sp. Silwood1]CAF3568779.1 unnamed protein product [Rotaria sp. Silwood1]CAF3584522.1 unnamed protein product [Rotaria sp. Silwood1]
MTTMKNSLARSSPLPSLHPVHANTQIKSTFATIQPILPNTPSTTVSKKCPTKKRVRFALKLETIEDLSSPKNDKPTVSTIKSNKRITNPRREDGQLYGAYVEYLEKQGALVSDISEVHRPSRPSPPQLPPHESERESSAHTKTHSARSKSPEIIVESITGTTAPAYLPHIVHPTAVTNKNNNNNRRPSLPIIDPNFKQRIDPGIPTHKIQSKKTLGSVSNRNYSNSVHSVAKRTALALPLIKDTKSNEKSMRADNSVGAKIVNEYCQSKKITEIISGTLPGANHQINHVSERSVLPNLSKTPPSPHHNHLNNEPYFFQNHNNDQMQPIIH